ncbi:NAD-dependent epimerase/dehydratase family protein [Clostridium autoethanogenum]|uniref:NAD-dependent epimerase/dehydratase family protein n=1 Tax=Clostridium autoethanogenum TaxID=84023 RepID=A0A3M0S151_9CLOT|nr:NAD-dependent epimerase/dehydratase family protein [Clostridium autoethanogenum]RMC92302.1 NAD-dependent epimerase/dehydratase family protein [Clostridium autoethanogenum]
MNSINLSEIYRKDLSTALNQVVHFEKLHGKSVLITGASGLIGSFITDILLYHNKQVDSEAEIINIYASGRSLSRLKTRFLEATSMNCLHLIEHDVNNEISFDFPVDYIIHAAGNAYPAVFSADPVGTIMSNVLGTKRLLDYAKEHDTKRFLFVSSGEVYGQGDLNLDAFEENYSGYVNVILPRSCYPSSKRTAETLCVSYTKQFGLDTVIVRPCHTYGPNATASDNRANVQFVNDALWGKDILLKSAGNQMRSYCYIADNASAILTVLLNGKKGEAYNIANKRAKISVAGFAKIVAEIAGKKVTFENPDEATKEEQTPITKAVLASDKLESLGWQGSFPVKEGIEHTLKILKELQ